MATNLDQETESYRVILHSIGGHTEVDKAQFCMEVSGHYGIPVSLMKKIVDRCPIVIKKDLPFKKAKLLAFALKSFGASVTVEKKKAHSPISLEFSAENNWRVELESSHLRKSPAGAWQIFGRVKNICSEELVDLWAMIQCFDEFGDMISFEEIPLPVNPLPQKESSPFKAIFEGSLPVEKISISFKSASGNPLLARDNREKKEWVEMKIAALEKVTSLPPPATIPEAALSQHPMITEKKGDRLEKAEIDRVSEETQFVEKENLPSWTEGEVVSFIEEISPDHLTGHDPKKEPLKTEPLQEEPEASEMIWPAIEPAMEKERVGEVEEELHLDDQVDDRLQEKPSGLDQGLLPHEEAAPSPVTAPPAVEEKKAEEAIPYPWMEEFRKMIAAFEQKEQDPFTIWFKHLQKESGFESVYHSLLTLLSYTRFNQTHSSESALENTKKIYTLPGDILIEEVPPLEGTPFFSGETWRDLYFRAIPKLHEVTRRILEIRAWDPFDLDRLIRIIPHMTDQNSHRTIRFIHDRIPQVTVDVSRLPVEITESLYRVAARLGVVNPFFDHYQGKNSMGDKKIQSFARSAFPEDPGRVEKLMNRLGLEDEEGPCSPTGPRCQQCPFVSFCQRLFPGLNPSEKGMVLRAS